MDAMPMTKDGITVIRSHLSGRLGRSAGNYRDIFDAADRAGHRAWSVAEHLVRERPEACWSCGFVRLRGELPGII
ncbi:hypothetical protein TPA0908_08440 [Micromonospora sp. AKA38]|nr:hypothetical protein TPA0908_08440 [Micromonospora sp. AKA38]